MVLISKPLPEDARRIKDLIKASWYATYINEEVGINKADIDAMYAENQDEQIEVLRSRATTPRENDISLVAKDGDIVVGFIRLKIHPELVDLLSLYILPNQEGKGIGTSLWQEALKVLPKDKPVIAEVATYTKAKDFYAKLGFIDTGERYTKEEDKMPVSGTCIPLMKMCFRK